jgi:hypothetical protein
MRADDFGVVRHNSISTKILKNLHYRRSADR